MEILLIVGSLRKESFNKTLALTAQKELVSKAEVTILNYSDIPLLNQDDTYPFPETVKRIRNTVSRADGIWFFSPEYNGSFTGVLKNLIDYLSLANERNNFASGSPLMGKPVTISGIGGRNAARSSAAALTVLLQTCRCKIMPAPECLFALPPQSFISGQWQPDENEVSEIKAQADAFIQFVGKEGQ